MIKSGLLLLICLSALSACSFVRGPSPEELALLDNPSIEVRAKQDMFAPLVLKWIDEVEANFLQKGRPLSESETDMARSLGVSHPERVRVAVLAEFPMPTDKILRVEAVSFGIGKPNVGGLTLGYVIFLKPKYQHKRWILAHELMHVVQQERMGRKAFIRRYIVENEIMGSRHRPMPLEMEANNHAFKYWPL